MSCFSYEYPAIDIPFPQTGYMRLTCRCANLHIPFPGEISLVEQTGKGAVRHYTQGVLNRQMRLESPIDPMLACSGT